MRPRLIVGEKIEWKLVLLRPGTAGYQKVSRIYRTDGSYSECPIGSPIDKHPHAL